MSFICKDCDAPMEHDSTYRICEDCYIERTLRARIEELETQLTMERDARHLWADAPVEVHRKLLSYEARWEQLTTEIRAAISEAWLLSAIVKQHGEQLDAETEKMTYQHVLNIMDRIASEAPDISSLRVVHVPQEGVVGGIDRKNR